eukprot:6123591-Karenia_brevis.AAC.1
MMKTYYKEAKRPWNATLLVDSEIIFVFVVCFLEIRLLEAELPRATFLFEALIDYICLPLALALWSM